MPKVKDFMTKGVLTIDKDKTIVEAAKLMAQKEVGDIAVLDVGIPPDTPPRSHGRRALLDSPLAVVSAIPNDRTHPDSSHDSGSVRSAHASFGLGSGRISMRICFAVLYV